MQLFGETYLNQDEGNGGNDAEPQSNNEVPDDNSFPSSWDEVFQHERFKQLVQQKNEAASELAKLKAEQAKAAERDLEKQNEWEVLAKQREEELKTLKLTTLRQEVAMRKEIPPDMVNRLVGNTIEELEKDADVMLKFLKPSTGPGVPPSPPGQPLKPFDWSNATAEEIREEMRGKSLNDLQ